VRKKLSFLIVVAVSFILSAQPLYVRADDGGDGSSGTGGSGDGSGTDSGTGTDGTGNGGTDSTGADDASNGDATTANDAPDAPSTDPSAVEEAAPSNDPSLATDPALAPSISFAPPSDPTTVTPVSPLDAIQSEATTDPRGGFNAINTAANGAGGLGPGGAAGTLAGTAPVDVRINAVIVSAAQSPWDVVTKAPGVRNVIVTGGIVALGKTPIEGEISGGGPQPTWLRLIPDLRLLNGSMFPPVVPNVIDIRIMSCPFKIEEPKPE
jgi:hypothetical protein